MASSCKVHWPKEGLDAGGKGGLRVGRGGTEGEGKEGLCAITVEHSLLAVRFYNTATSPGDIALPAKQHVRNTGRGKSRDDHLTALEGSSLKKERASWREM